MRILRAPSVLSGLIVLLLSVSAGAQTVPEAIPRDVPGVSTGYSVQMLLLLTAYCAAVVLASLLGGWLASLVNMTHTVSQTIISFVGGLMLGIGVFHLLPHALHGGQTASQAAGWMMAGIVAFELAVTALQCKIKLNQHRPESHAAMRQAYAEGAEDAQALGRWMERLGLTMPPQEGERS